MSKQKNRKMKILIISTLLAATITLSNAACMAYMSDHPGAPGALQGRSTKKIAKKLKISKNTAKLMKKACKKDEKFEDLENCVVYHCGIWDKKLYLTSQCDLYAGKCMPKPKCGVEIVNGVEQEICAMVGR